jgi:hypothetical protein
MRILPGRERTVGYGFTLQQIRDKLLKGRDLSKKGSRKPQLDYAERHRSQGD